MPGLSGEKQALGPIFSTRHKVLKKTNNIGPILDPITLSVQRKLEEIIEQKTDPNWTLKMLETTLFENLPSGTENIFRFTICVRIHIFHFYYYYFFVFQGRTKVKYRTKLAWVV